MNIKSLLTEHAFDLLIDAASSSPTGGLITVGELLASDIKADESVILSELLKDLDSDSVVLKAYVQKTEIKIIGASVHVIGDAFGLFGRPLPKSISLTKTKENRGNGPKAFTVAIARLTMSGPDGELVTLDLDFAKPAESEYFAWAKSTLAGTKADMLSNIGNWVEPNLTSGGTKVSLTDIPKGKYQVTGINSENRVSKQTGKPYICWSLDITAADCEFSTWASIMPNGLSVGLLQQRMIERGKVMCLDVQGLRDQTNNQGAPRLNPDGAPYQELVARLYPVQSEIRLSPFEREQPEASTSSAITVPNSEEIPF